MTRGRKPLGDRAMTDAERKQRRREKQKTSDRENAYRFRRSLLNTLDRWADSVPLETAAVIAYDALSDLAMLLTLSAGRSVKERGVLRIRYLNSELLDASSIEDLLGGADALKRAAEKPRDV